MQFYLAYGKVSELKADYEVVFVKGDVPADCEDREALEFAGFKEGSVLDLVGARRVYVSIKNNKPETVRLAIAKALKAIDGHKVRTIKLAPPVCRNAGPKKALAAIAEGFLLSSYRFDKYKSEKKEQLLEEVYVASVGTRGEEIPEDMAEGLDMGRAIAEATNYTRDLVNEVPNECTPETMAAEAEKLAACCEGVTAEVFGPDYLKEEGMNTFLAVAQAGPKEPRLIHLTYKSAGECKGKIAFVGKGLTYDSGGLSLKSNKSMYTMKDDMAGAGAALGIIRAAAELGLPYEIHSVLGCTENMVGSNACKPDDIIVSHAGVTVEITNTDAEGRLVLADCLSWTCKYVAPDRILDLATLTGSAVNALGAQTTAVIGRSRALQAEYEELASESGELFAPMYFNDYLAETIRSKVADVRNASLGMPGGAQTAGLFLEQFLPEEYREKWLHLDIAGPAYADEAWGCYCYGATGAGVRANLYYMLELAEKTR